MTKQSKKLLKVEEAVGDIIKPFEFIKTYLGILRERTEMFIKWLKYETYKKEKLYEWRGKNGSMKIFTTQGGTLLIEWTEIEKKRWGVHVVTYSRELQKEEAINMAKAILEAFGEK